MDSVTENLDNGGLDPHIMTPIENAPDKPAPKKRGRKSNAERAAMESSGEAVTPDSVKTAKKSDAKKRNRVIDESEIIGFGKQIQGLHEIAHAVTGLKSVRIGEETGKQVANSIVIICDKFGIDLFGTMGIVGAVATLAVVYIPMTMSARAEYAAKNREAETVPDFAP